MNLNHHYVEQGAGFPLLLLHGNGEDCSYFAHQLFRFSEHYHVYAIDTRGHGKTERGTAPFTIRQFAEDLLSFMNTHEIEKANVLGFSDGANIAMIFAMKYPNRVNKLVLNGGNLNPDGMKRSVQIPIEIGYRIAQFFARFQEKAKAKADLLALMVEDPNIAPEELAGIKAPTLVIAGNRDMVKEEHTRLIAKSIPGAELQFLDGDHFVASNNPNAYNDAVAAFLSKNPQ
ncbi:MAG: alpha/beta hydrolase [Bacillota bacterium]|nr:alpha/beta hydrolase [Bacillota bacterium]